MPLLLAPLINIFWMLFGAGIWYVVKLIGFGLVTYTGMNYATDTVLAYIKSNMTGIAPDILSILGLLGFDVAVNVIITVLSVRLLHMGISGGGSRTKVAWKRPADMNVTNGIFKA